MKNLFCLIGLALLVSCNKELTFEIKEIKSNPCTDDFNCAHVQLDVVFATNKGVVADSINHFFLEATKNLLLFDETTQDTTSTYEGLLKKFIKMYHQTKKELEIENYLLDFQNCIFIKRNIGEWYKKPTNLN
jgi:hypothetical protein